MARFRSSDTVPPVGFWQTGTVYKTRGLRAGSISSGELKRREKRRQDSPLHAVVLVRVPVGENLFHSVDRQTVAVHRKRHRLDSTRPGGPAVGKGVSRSTGSRSVRTKTHASADLRERNQTSRQQLEANPTRERTHG